MSWEKTTSENSTGLYCVTLRTRDRSPPAANSRLWNEWTSIEAHQLKKDSHNEQRNL